LFLGAAAQVVMALLGGGLAAGTHLAKAGARAAINTSPEPVSNLAASLGEDGLVALGLWALFHHPLWFLGGLALFMLLAGWLLIRLWRLARGVFRRGAGPAPAQTAD
jgi:hypothetical protein